MNDYSNICELCFWDFTTCKHNHKCNQCQLLPFNYWTKFAFKYHTRFDTANDKWNAISSTICFDDMLNYFLQQTIYYPKLMVIFLHLTSLIYCKPWQTDKFQIEILRSRKKSYSMNEFHLINPCQCPSHHFSQRNLKL